MTVALSMLTLVPGEMGGSETYAQGLAGALVGEEVDAVAFVPATAPDAGAGLPTVVVRAFRPGTSGATKGLGMAAAALPRSRAARPYAGVDVVHYPFTVPVPRLALPSVVTLHDLQHLDLPALFTRGRRLFRRLAYDRAARHADVVVVPSAFVRDHAVGRLGLDPGRVHVIHHGVDHAVFHPAERDREPFLLYPARTWPHKNHARLLEAFARVRAGRPELRLVLAGGGTGSLPAAPGVDGLGVVGIERLVDLYQRASALVFPSLYEGFGAPPLEAMACGTPVAASRSGSVPEICGDAAVLFDPRDTGSIAAGIDEALTRADELSRVGLAHAAGFTWQESARRHVTAYGQAASTRS